MEPIKGVDTEKKTPTTPGAGEAGNKTTEELLKEAQERLAEKETQAKQLTEELRKAREISRQPLISNPVLPKPVTPQEPDDLDQDDFDTKYEKRRTEEKTKEYISRVNRVHDRFLKLPEVDVDGEIDIQFRKLANNMHLGETDEEVMEKFQVIYRGLKPSSEKKEDKEGVTIGDGGSEETNRPKGKVDWLSKPLNKYELAAANTYPGGEPAWRKRRQEKADKGEI